MLTLSEEKAYCREELAYIKGRIVALAKLRRTPAVQICLDRQRKEYKRVKSWMIKQQ